jgi:general secretion pathway protein C
VTSVTGGWLVLEVPTPAPRVHGAAASTPLVASRPAAGEALVARNMFCAGCTGAAPSAEVPPAARPTPRLVVLATLVGEPAEHGMAALRDLDSGRQGGFAVGQAVPGGWRLVAVEPGAVILEQGGERATLRIGPPVAAAPPVAPPTATAASVEVDGIRRLADGTVEIDRRLLDEVRGDPLGRLGARGLPVSDRGKVVGLRLAAVRPRSPVAALGLGNGDVIVAVDGTPLDSVDAMLKLVGTLERADAMTVHYRKRGAASAPSELRVRLR